MNATLITGAAGGIGREFAKIYAAKGNDIIAVDLHQDSLNKLKDELVAINKSIQIYLIFCFSNCMTISAWSLSSKRNSMNIINLFE